MSIQKKIYENLVSQFRLILDREELRKKADRIEKEWNTTVGRMSVLSEFFKESTGKDLESLINSDPDWITIVAKAKAEASGSQSAQTESATVSEPTVEKVEQKKIPAIRKLTGNKQLEVSPEKKEAPAEKQIRSNLSDRNQPIRMTIDDSPPVIDPGAEVRDLDDD